MTGDKHNDWQELDLAQWGQVKLSAGPFHSMFILLETTRVRMQKLLIDHKNPVAVPSTLGGYRSMSKDMVW